MTDVSAVSATPTPLLPEQTPLQRATTNAQITVQPERATLSQAFLSSANGIQAQIVSSGLSAASTTLFSVSRAQVAYESSAALVSDAVVRNEPLLNEVA